MEKKKLGIIGGMGSRAGAFFLQRIIDHSPAETDQEFLEIIFHNNSLTPDRTRAIVYNETSPLESILRSVDLFNQNQVEVMALGCITAYYYYEQICRHTDATVLNPLHLVNACIRHEHPRAKRIGLLATTGTINSGLFHESLNRHDLQVITLDPDDQEEIFMRSVYMRNGFKSAHISGYAKQLLHTAIEKLGEQQVDVIIGGCTEVSVGMHSAVIDFPYIDALDLLARKTVDYCYNADFIKI